MKTLSVLLSILALLGNNSNAQVVKVNEPDVCFQCHSDTEELLQKSHLHGAFEAGVCSDCHNPHATKHASLLNDEVKPLCFECHDDFGGLAEDINIHQPVGNGECLTCHNPHASDNVGLLNDKAIVLCSGCHKEAATWLERTNVHKPVSDGNCGACHDPHASKYESLVIDGVPALCFKCHELDERFKTAHQGEGLSKANCTTCHDPHASNKAGLIMANQHKPFADGSCKSCHETVDGAMTFGLTDKPQKLCSKCHSAVARLDKLAYHHIQDDDNSCLNCHNPHASSTESLLMSAQQDLCTNCHFNNNPDKSKEELITHKGLVCTSCHSPHGSDRSTLLTLASVDLCKGCHEDAHRVTHPIGDDILDPRTSEPMTCLSCHKLHGSDFEKYLPLDPQMDLCIQCHKR